MIRGTQTTIYFEARSLTTGARVPGLTVTATVSKDGGSAASSSNAPVEVGTSGVYQLTLTTTETDAGVVAILPTTTTDGVFLPLVQVETETPVTVPTVADIQAGLATSAEITALETYGDTHWVTADVSGLSTLTASDIPTVAAIQSGLATSVEITALETYGDTHWTTANVSGLSTLTASDLPTVPTAAENAAEVWSTTARTLTASPTDISGLATSADIATLQTHGDSTWTTADVSGVSTLTASDIPTVTAIQSGLATSAEITSLQNHGDSSWATGTGGTVDLTEVLSALEVVTGLVGHWTITTNTLTTYNDAGTVLHTYTITRDTDGEITSITEAT